MTEPIHLVFRLRKYYRNLGIVSLTFFVGMWAMSLIVVLREEKFLAAFTIGGIWFFFIGLSLWMLLAYRRESLTIRDDTIIQKGVLRTKCLGVEDVLGMWWQSTRSVVLRSKTQKIKIYLDNFTRDERQQLIEYLRLAVPPSLQQGWDRFCYQLGSSVVDWTPDQPLQEGYMVRTRKHIDLLCLPAILFALAAGIGFALYLEQPRWLATPVAVVLLWLVLRMFIPAKGLVMREQTDFDKRFTWGLLIWAALGIGVAFLLPVIWAFVWMFLWISVLLYHAQRADRHKWQRLEDDIQQAVDRWDQEHGTYKPATTPELPAE